jgi:hypothetical protein
MVRAGSAGAAIDGDPVSMENGERREGEGDESHPREEEKDTSTFS